ncbi:uncharacterized protein LOC128999925 [Macrosteles quadrilineatus]|uniref:uncharacterized protein LOC128999925 n=1 Tax=Macrosteles quadrilineatus TaxID=74068 RepID=UPI0023E27800|nr:uncharacterized protein LOC128999925 [Macrosteles quadrilineatus]
MYVDKSLLINRLLERDEKVFQIIRPRRWGKTVNLEMLKTFFEIESDENAKPLPEEKRKNTIFFNGGELKISNDVKVLEPLKISKIETAMEKMGKHPVIYLNLSQVKGKSVSEIGKKLNKVIVNLYRSYPFLAKYLDNETTILDEDEIPRLDNFLSGSLDKEYMFDSLEFLSMLLFEHFESYVCLLVDDYDLPLINAFSSLGQGSEFNFVLEMFKRLYDYTFKENQYLLKAVITGSLNFDVVPSGVGEFDYQYVLYDTVFDEPFTDYFGFTETEVGKLVQNVHQMDRLKEWYGGFFVNKTEMYNPGSIVGFLTKQEFDYYLLQSNSDLVKFAYKGFLSPQYKDFLLLSGESKEVVIEKYAKTIVSENVGKDFYSIFINLGYLNLITPKRYAKEEIWRIQIPNVETKGIFAAGFKHWIATELNVTETESQTLIDFLKDHDVEKFANKLEIYLEHSKVYDLKTEEGRYHNLMSALIASLGIGNEVSTIREVGSYRGESVVIPIEGFGNTMIHFEYNICKVLQKVGEIVEESLRSLMLRPDSCKQKHLRDHVEKVLYVAVGFLGHKVSVKGKFVDVKK